MLFVWVRSAADIPSQLITCILTSATHSRVCCAGIPNSYVVKLINPCMTFEFYVALRKAHSEITLFNFSMFFPLSPHFWGLSSHHFKIHGPSGICFAMRGK